MKLNVGTQEKMSVPISAEKRTKSKLMIPYFEWRKYVDGNKVVLKESPQGVLWSCPGCGKPTKLTIHPAITEADCCGPACFAVAVLRWQAAREGQ